MAGTVTFSERKIAGTPVKAIIATCTADASNGSFPATALPSFSGRLLSMQTNPGSTAPTDDYDITLIDGDGLDRLAGVGVNRDTTNSESAPIPGAPPVYMGETLTLTIANNSVNSAVVVVTFYYDATGTSAVATTGTAGSPSSSVTSVQGVTSGTPVAVGFKSVKVSVTPTLDTGGAYASGDTLATAVLTFAGCARANGLTGTITKLVVIDSDLQSAVGELWLFDTAVTPAAANAAHSISDADAGHCLGVIPFGPYYASALNSVSVNSSVRLTFKAASADTALYGIAVTRATPTYTSAGLTFSIVLAQD